LFLPAKDLVVFANQGQQQSIRMTEWGVQLYFWARVAYVALYAAGIFLLRSLVWNVSALGIGLVLLSML
jgi:uncharacterized MAPEG superfamily protein